MKYLVLDIECSKIPRHNPWSVGSFLSSVGIEHEDCTSTVWFFNPNDRPHEDMLKEIQAEIDSVDVIVGHNIKFDINWLKWSGLNVEGKSLWCTQIAEYLLNGERKVEYSLNASCARYGLGSKLDAMAMYWDAGYETDEIPLPIHETYLKQDISLTHQLFKQQVPLIEKFGLSKVAELSFTISQILSNAEVYGAKFDKESAKAYVAEARADFEKLDSELVRLAGVEFSPGSTQQLGAVLFGGSWKVDGRETYTVTLKNGTVKEKSRKIKVDFTFPGLGFEVPEGCVSAKTGRPSTGKETIDQLVGRTATQKSVIDLLKKQKKISKVVSTITGTKDDKGLLSVIGNDGYIHPTFNQTVTATGRLSSSNPNGQNLPRKGTSPIKKFFLPKNGYIVNLDLGQIEWRIAAELSRDPVMLDELNHGLDFHADNALKFFGADKFPRDSDEFDKRRNTAKTFGFRMLYGGSAYAFYKDARMPDFSLKRWEEIVKAFYTKYRGLKAWQDANVALASAQGYLRSPSGRVLTFSYNVNKRTGVEEIDHKQVYNYPIQSVSADIMYVCMAEFHKLLREQGCTARMILQVHDSMVFDTPKSEVETICKLAVPFFKNLAKPLKAYFGWDVVVPLVGDCEVGYTYGSTKKCKDKDFDTIFKDLDSFLTA